MDPTTVSILTKLLGGLLTKAAEKAFEKLFSKHPKIESDLTKAIKSQDTKQIETALASLVGVIQAEAGSGTITIDDTIIKALNGATFNHQHGIIEINRTKINSKTIVIGGGQRSTGKTTMTNVSSQTNGTSIEVKGNSGITIKGNAKVTQT